MDLIQHASSGFTQTRVCVSLTAHAHQSKKGTNQILRHSESHVHISKIPIFIQVIAGNIICNKNYVKLKNNAKQYHVH